MTKNILAIAIAAAVMAPSAFAAATVYGNAHMSANSLSSVSDGGSPAVKDSFSSSNGAGTIKAGSAAVDGVSTGMTSLSSNSSYLGIKGDEDLGGGMKAVYQMEFGVDMDGTTSGVTSTRNTFVGLGGGFGTVLAGRHDSLIKLSGRKYDLFGDQMGNNRNILGGSNSIPVSSSTGGAGTTTMSASGLVDGRHNNVLAYVSPTWSGFHFGVAYVPTSAVTGQETYDNAGSKQSALTAIADYDVGNFSVTAGYINVANVLGANGVNVAPAQTTNLSATGFTAYRLGAGYTFGAAKVVALYQNAGADGSAKQDTYGLGGSYKVGAAGTVKAQYYTAADVNAGKVDATLTTVGYDHAMSKNTTAYVVYAAAHNDTAANISASMANSGAGSNVTGVAGKDNSAVSVGIIHKF